MSKTKLKLVKDVPTQEPVPDVAKLAALEGALSGLQIISIVYLPDGSILRLQTAVNGQQMPQLRAIKMALSNVIMTVDNAIDQLFRNLEETAKAPKGPGEAAQE